MFNVFKLENNLEKHPKRHIKFFTRTNNAIGNDLPESYGGMQQAALSKTALNKLAFLTVSPQQ